MYIVQCSLLITQYTVIQCSAAALITHYTVFITQCILYSIELYRVVQSWAQLASSVDYSFHSVYYTVYSKELCSEAQLASQGGSL